jgi:uncharacterized membrane protein
MSESTNYTALKYYFKFYFLSLRRFLTWLYPSSGSNHFQFHIISSVGFIFNLASFKIIRCLWLFYSKRKKYFISPNYQKNNLILVLIRWLLNSNTLFRDYFHHLFHFISVQCSCSVLSDSMWPHGPQHTRPPSPSSNLRVHPN